MKRILHLTSVVLLGLVVSYQLKAQCVPDTINCVDTTGNPGEICPLDLPDAGLNAVYDQTITIIPPGSYLFSGVELSIFHIEIDSLINLPPGIGYAPNADIFFPDTAYCIQLNGTPTETGTFDLAIYITATVDLGQPVRYQVVDDSSISITVVEELSTGPFHNKAFRVNQNTPNPFSAHTKLSFYTPREESVELRIYNLIGNLVHQEKALFSPGLHQFEFNGSRLPPGTYLYRVEIEEAFFTGKILKSR